ncbi:MULTISPECIES: hemophore [Mycobacterium]|uniref:Fis family transcriptional regulator n=1 Tax=Mycobacterium gordonae TaxID=1778 RepID=A0A1X1WQY2_MYCGO|nr:MULTISPECIES: hemophore [Mycobacterium]MBI2703329.1 hemophore [Mycobacterium sp.]MBX9982281.1 hemophore [Mycobacterium gordonae]MCV7006568.1 hemophore [Mycobacterium gordonae]ODR21953.1 hemophore [Mycobacterium gordonae]ORV88984.1 Fis family transcriptional regulator [Mycobacterium gordonae]
MPSTPFLRRGLFALVAATGLSCAGSAVLGAPAATGSTDPCAASEVARTIGSVAKSTGDYLDSHPETNQVMTSALQQQAGPQSLGSVKAYFEANPKVALDMQGLANPLNKLGTQCKLPISLPQALSMVQAAQGGGLPGLPAGGLPAAGTPAGQPNGTGPLPGPKPANG